MTDKKQLIKTESLKPELVFKDNGIDALIEQVRKDAVITAKPEDKEYFDEIRSVAYQIKRSKTAIDDMGKDYVAELKKVTGAVDEKRRRWRLTMDDIEAEVRKPLTDFENAEKERLQAHNDAINFIRTAVNFDYEPSSEDIEKIMLEVEEKYNRDFQEFADQAKTVKENTTGRLSEKLAAQIKYEEDQKELARLKEEKAEQDRLAEIDSLAKIKAEEIVKKSEPTIQEMGRQEEEDGAKNIDNSVSLKEEPRADQDKALEHKRSVNRKIVSCMVEDLLISEKTAQDIVKAIVSGNIPNVQINY